MHGLNLNSADRQTLERLIATDAELSAQLVLRAHVLLRMARGASGKQVAVDLNVGASAVQSICRIYRVHGLNGIISRRQLQCGETAAALARALDRGEMG